MPNFTVYTMSVELIVSNCVCPGICALVIVVFLSVPLCAHVPMQVSAHVWVYECSTATLCPCACLCPCVLYAAY